MELAGSVAICSTSTGAVNGWWEGARPPSSVGSNVGKSITNSGASSSWPAGLPSSSRSWPSTSATVLHSSAASSSTSPGLPDSAVVTPSSSSGERNLATGERSDPSSSTTIHTSPLAPSSFARSVRASIRDLVDSIGPALSPRTTPPDSSAPLNARNSESAKTADRSTISIPNRMSGLSDPYRSIASCHVSLGNGVSSSSPLTARETSTTICSSTSRTSSRSQKDPSKSSWANSTCRSDRKSSSR